MNGRRTGRTKAMVEALPASGAVVVVHNRTMREYVEQMIDDLRGRAVREVIDVCVVNNFESAQGALMGRRVPILLDHAFEEKAPAHVMERVRVFQKTAVLHKRPAAAV